MIPQKGDVTVVIETPKGSRNKYAYDPDMAAFRLKFVLPEGTSFPYDFGFIPSTLGEDGDPLDVLLLLDQPTPVGCVIGARLIGAIEARQKEEGHDWARNDRLIAVATHARSHAHLQRLDDLRPGMVDEICAFFTYYNHMNGKEFEPGRRRGPKGAQKLVTAGCAAYLDRGSQP